MSLSQEEILNLIEQPKNREILDTAKRYELELKHFYARDYTDAYNDNVVCERARPLLTGKKFTKFKEVYQNYALPLVNKVQTHYSKIFSSFGGVFEYRFNGEKIDAQVAFEDSLNTIYNGISDKEYWSENGHVLVNTQPNSIFLTTTKKDGLLRIKHIPLDHIHDVEANEAGIEYVIIQNKIKVDDKDLKMFHVFDDTFFHILLEKSSGFQFVEFEEDGTIKELEQINFKEHGAKSCPAVFASAKLLNEPGNEFILRKSLISDSIPDLYDYVILKTLYLHYKQFSAFGKEIRAQTRCSYKDEELNVSCDGKGFLNPIFGNKTSKYPLGGNICPTCAEKNKNKGVGGEVVEIPIEMQGNEAYIANLPNLFQRINADSSILTFHSDDIKSLEDKILSDSIGSGFGEGFRRQAVNADQVMFSYDDIESNLNREAKSIEKTWSYSVNRAGEMFSSSFVDSLIKLGRNHLLKTTEQLYEELKIISSTTSNLALIGKKKKEILLTESRNNDRLIRRSSRLDQVVPFMEYSAEYVSTNKDTLFQISPEGVDLYYSKTQVLAIFEALNGPVEDFGAGIINEFGEPDEEAAIKKIREELLNIMKNNGLTNDREQPGEPGSLEIEVPGGGK